MAKDQMGTAGVTRRQFASVASAAAAGWLLTACGPRRLHEIPRDRLREAIKEWERDYSERYGQAVTVSDAGPMPGVLFAMALDLSRCNGNRRCVDACVAENNQSRDPQVQWIRVLSMNKDKGIDFSDADPYYEPEGSPRAEPVLRADGLPALPERAVHEGLSGRGHVDRARRHRGHRLRLVHRLPVLHGRLSVRRTPFQLGRATGSAR